MFPVLSLPGNNLIYKTINIQRRSNKHYNGYCVMPCDFILITVYLKTGEKLHFNAFFLFPAKGNMSYI
jgi:hypothetical protein